MIHSSAFKGIFPPDHFESTEQDMEGVEYLHQKGQND